LAAALESVALAIVALVVDAILLFSISGMLRTQ